MQVATTVGVELKALEKVIVPELLKFSPSQTNAPKSILLTPETIPAAPGAPA